MELKAWFCTIRDCFWNAPLTSVLVFGLVGSSIFFVALTTYVWWCVFTAPDTNLVWYLSSQAGAFGMALLFYKCLEADDWLALCTHDRFGFLGFCGVSTPVVLSLIYLHALPVLWLTGVIGWTVFVVFYTRFYFTYKVFCDVRD